MAKSNQYVVILCGGSGPRLWPLSHAGHPKQFLKILGKKTLLEQTFSRCQNFALTKIFLLSPTKNINQKLIKSSAKNFHFKTLSTNLAKKTPPWPFFSA